MMTGTQINALAAMSPAYTALPPNSPLLFAADLARDTDRDELRRIQACLNALGYSAGPEDGAMGGKTRRAIAVYKADHGLAGGPIPSRRLLARLNSTVARTEDRRLALLDGAGADQKRALVDAVVDAAAADPAAALHFDILGMRTGTSRRAIESAMAGKLDGNIRIATGTTAQFGGAGKPSLGHVMAPHAGFA